MDPHILRARVEKFGPSSSAAFEDSLAVEEPLEIRLDYGPAGNRRRKTLSVTMRTPGEDRELTAGFLLTEGIITSPGDLEGIDDLRENVTLARLAPHVKLPRTSIERNFYTTSSCGVCGKSSIAAVKTKNIYSENLAGGIATFPRTLISRLPALLRAAQKIFDQTGGLHASGLFGQDGSAIAVREDVGRHNALDKVLGASFLDGKLPLAETVLALSGRVSFELVQKAAMAGIPAIVAVGAPSSLALKLAGEMNMLLAGFVRDETYNIYCGREKLR